MEIIPVIDLMDGVVVRAYLGQRKEYRPIATPLSPTSDPVDVVRGFLTLHAFQRLYVADLDAIERRGSNRSTLRRLRSEFEVQFWIDSGIADSNAAQDWLDSGLGDLVLGSESQIDGRLSRQLRREPRLALSLDFRDRDFLGPSELLADPQAWPQRLIIMTLARIGGVAGPDHERIAAVRELAGTRTLYAGGGVRGPGDLLALERAGVAGALVASCLHDGRLTREQIAALADRNPPAEGLLPPGSSSDPTTGPEVRETTPRTDA